MPRASVIIPCFNSRQWIRDAIESALAQTHADTEVIVVDDGSTDGSLDAIRSFGDRIRFTSGENRGACAARNTGIAMATGEYIQFLDADDLLHPDKISRSLEVLEKNQNALVFSLHEVVSLDSGVPAVQWSRRDECDDALLFMLRGDLPTPSPLHRTETLERIGGFDESLPCAQDRDLHLRLAMAGVTFIRIPEVMHTIRRRSGSIGTSDPLRVHRFRGKIAWATFQQLQQLNRLTDSYRIHCAAMCLHAARRLFVSDPEGAVELMDQAAKIHPTMGLSLVYSWKSRMLCRLLGPRLTEQILSRSRS